MIFEDIEFEHNRAFILLGDLINPYTPPERTGIDTSLLQFLQQLPNLITLELPLQPSVLKTVGSVLQYRMARDKESFDLVFGTSPVIVQPVSGACGHVFQKGEGIYRCRYF